MRLLRRLAVLVLAGVLILATPSPAGAAPAASAAPTVPVLVGIRAAHHPTFDRIVFDFRDGLPAGRGAVKWHAYCTSAIAPREAAVLPRTTTVS